MAVGVCVCSTLNVQYWAWETLVAFAQKECRAGAPSCSWAGLLWTLAYCQSPCEGHWEFTACCQASKIHMVRTKWINHHCFELKNGIAFKKNKNLSLYLLPLLHGQGKKCESSDNKTQNVFFWSCQERCVSQLWEENWSSLTELLHFKMVVNEASCVGPSVFLLLEISLLKFLLTFLGSRSLKDIQVSAPFDYECYCPSSCF